MNQQAEPLFHTYSGFTIEDALDELATRRPTGVERALLLALYETAGSGFMESELHHRLRNHV